MHSTAPDDALPFMDRALPGAWSAASSYAAAITREVTDHGLAPAEGELIKLRVSQLNECLFCLDLHSRQARRLGVTQQKLDLLPAWRETPIFSRREAALLTVAEIATRLPLSHGSRADLVAARDVLGEASFVSAEWVAITINAFNRISILSDHPVRPRDEDGKPS